MIKVDQTCTDNEAKCVTGATCQTTLCKCQNEYQEQVDKTCSEFFVRLFFWFFFPGVVVLRLSVYIFAGKSVFTRSFKRSLKRFFLNICHSSVLTVSVYNSPTFRRLFVNLCFFPTCLYTMWPPSPTSTPCLYPPCTRFK